MSVERRNRVPDGIDAVQDAGLFTDGTVEQAVIVVVQARLTGVGIAPEAEIDRFRSGRSRI